MHLTFRLLHCCGIGSKEGMTRATAIEGGIHCEVGMEREVKIPTHTTFPLLPLPMNAFPCAWRLPVLQERCDRDGALQYKSLWTRGANPSAWRFSCLLDVDGHSFFRHVLSTPQDAGLLTQPAVFQLVRFPVTSV